ncbi:MAG: tetratricopeptide repeat protein [Xenococcus sp. (in: cyanobacteria)]
MSREINHTSNAVNLPDTPYKGLEPYSEADAPFFFGRKCEWEIFEDNLMASRLTILYGDSGVGKSSLLQAGVAYHMLQDAKKNLTDYKTPEFAVVVFNSWQDDPLEALVKQVEKDIKSLLNGKTFEPLPLSLELDQILEKWSERLNEPEGGGELFIILDQFEEYFLYHPNEKGSGTFADQFSHAVNLPDLHTNFLISIREASLAKLDFFKGRIEEDILKNRLELEPLDKVSAEEAIIKPIEKYNELIKKYSEQQSSGQKVYYEQELVKKVLEEIFSEGYVQTPYLQLVMKRLWKEEVVAMKPLPEGKREDYSYCLQLKTLENLSGVSGIIKDHVKKKIDELPLVDKEVVAHIFYYLVTPSGQKIAYSVSDLASYAGLNTEELVPLLECLANGDNRILRTVKPSSETNEQRYEIFSDALAKPILEWLKGYLQEVANAEKFNLFVQTRLDHYKKKEIQSHWDTKKNNYWYWYEEAKYLENNKHYEEAINYYDQALKIRPQDYDCLYGRSRCLYSRGRSLEELGHYEEAINYYDQALEIRLQDYDCLYHSGRSLEKLGHYQKRQGNSRKAQEFYRKAIDNFKQARAVRDEDFWACFSQGYLEYELHQYNEAIASFEEALAVRSNDEGAHFYLNKSKEKAGRG